MKTILITGVAGFIGHHLALRWINMGYKVIGIDNFSTSNGKNLEKLPSDKFEFYEFDVTQNWPEQLLESSARPEYIFHLASPAAVNQYTLLSLETLSANSIGLEKVLTWAKTRKSRVIFASTSEIYGSPQVHPQPEEYWGSVNSYGERSCYDEGKRYGEALIYHWNKRHQTKHGLVRIFNTYGPGMNPLDGRVCYQFISKALRNENIQIYGTGLQTRSFCFINDLVDGLILYSRSGMTDAINLGNDEEVTIQSLASTILALTKSHSKIVKISKMMDDPPQRRPDLTKAKTFLSYRPKTNLVEGLSQLIYFMRQDLQSSTPMQNPEKF